MRMTPSTLQCSHTPLSVSGSMCGSPTLLMSAWGRVKLRAVCCIVNPLDDRSYRSPFLPKGKLRTLPLMIERRARIIAEHPTEQLVVDSTENQGVRGDARGGIFGGKGSSMKSSLVYFFISYFSEF
ncbi:hypothetical protein D3C75_224250 [compost metagenome]